MEDQEQQRNKKERTRFLNVIYFIDSARTRTFKISLKTAFVLLGTIVVLICWSLISTGLLIQTTSESSDKSLRIRSLLATIFTYQTRYDNVYEKSYPEGGEPILTATEEPDATTDESISDQNDEEALSLAAKTKPSAATVGAKPQPELRAATTSPTKEKPEEIPPIGIEKVEWATTEERLEFKFALRNQDSPNLASGYVIGQATFKPKSGPSQKILSPPNVALDDKVPLYKLSRNHRFSIRYYKEKLLPFVKPKGLEGHFESVRIVIGDKEGNRKEILYNLKKEEIDSVRGTSGPGVKHTKSGS
jgi:hypothetical protein